jgi:hypothetical protein
MKFFGAIRALFGAAGLCAGALCIALSFQNMDASPVLVEQPEAARKQVEFLMEAVCENNYAQAGTVILGDPVLGADRAPADPVGVLIWDAFVESIRYELVGELYATDSGVAQDITVTTLDISSVTERLKERSTKLLEQRVQDAENADEVYAAKNEYREDFVMQVLYDAALQALEEDAKTETCNISINMVYKDGQWWIVSSSDLLRAISGGVLK